MIHPNKIFNTFHSLGYGPYVSIPCSILKPLINYIVDKSGAEYYAATDEGEALGIASGMKLAGKKPVVMMQNSGLGNMIDPLTSLSLVFSIPVLLVISWRGEPDKPDEPQHKIMGSLMTKFLKTMGIKYEILREQSFDNQIKKLHESMNHTYKPAALIIPKGVIEPYQSEKQKDGDTRISMFREYALKTIMSCLKGDEAVVASTGKISRELYFMKKKVKAPFYVLGSMGCAGSIAFGLAEVLKEKKVVVLDGDGALLMKMGTLATIGHYNPKNILHIVLDNEAHESTGGQKTVSRTVFFDKIAQSCGYKNVARVYILDELEKKVKKYLDKEGPNFIHAKVMKGSDPDLGRPGDTPTILKDKFLNSLY